MNDIDAAENLGERLESMRRAAEFEEMGIEDPMSQPERLRNVRAMNDIDRWNELPQQREDLRNLVAGFEREDESKA